MPWACGICSKPFRQKKKTIMNYRIVASIIYDMITQMDSTLPSVQQLQHTALTMSSKSLTVTGEPNEASSIFNSIKSWLLRTNVDELESGIEEQLIKDPKLIESIGEMGKFLLPKRYFASIQSSLDTWIAPLVQDLDKWVDMVVKQVIIMKYDPPAELPDVSTEAGTAPATSIAVNRSNDITLKGASVTSPRI
jgi:hypothetical protein